MWSFIKRESPQERKIITGASHELRVVSNSNVCSIICSDRYQTKLHITGHLWGESIGHRWIPIMKGHNWVKHLHAMKSKYPFQWRHNGCDDVSNYQPRDCLLNRLFMRRSKKISTLRFTGLCREFTGGRWIPPHKWPVTREMFPFDDVIMSLMKCQWHAIQLNETFNKNKHDKTNQP